MTATLVLSGTRNLGTPPMASRARAWAAIQSGKLCVQLFRIGKARRTQHRHENLCRAPFAGEPVHDNRHRVAGIVHEQLLTRRMGCPSPPAAWRRTSCTAHRSGCSQAVRLWAMYSSQRMESVTCLRLISRWIEAQSGSVRRAGPGLAPPLP